MRSKKRNNSIFNEFLKDKEKVARYKTFSRDGLMRLQYPVFFRRIKVKTVKDYPDMQLDE